MCKIGAKNLTIEQKDKCEEKLVFIVSFFLNAGSVQTILIKNDSSKCFIVICEFHFSHAMCTHDLLTHH